MQWIKWVIVGLLVLIVGGICVKEYQGSQVVGHAQYRFNMALIGKENGVTFVTYDPIEKSILEIPFPTNLAITSRTSGEYSISSLYKLGAYEGEGGKFARQKIQGFMRVPIPGYLVTNNSLKVGLFKTIFGQTESSLSRLDAIMLFYRANRYSHRMVKEDELVRAGVINNNNYYPDRLQEYVGTRLFDWGIGGAGITVAIVNASGENGLGSDMADFLSNLGLDVVMVRSASSNELIEVSQWQVATEKSASELGYIFQNLFGFNEPKLETVPEEFRSTVLIKVGKDAKELF
jgi:hypothetical protein